MRTSRISPSRVSDASSPLLAIEVAQQETARARGWATLGDGERAEAALDRAMVALTDAEDDCPVWARPLVERLHAELDRAAAFIEA